MSVSFVRRVPAALVVALVATIFAAAPAFADSLVIDDAFDGTFGLGSLRTFSFNYGSLSSSLTVDVDTSSSTTYLSITDPSHSINGVQYSSSGNIFLTDSSHNLTGSIKASSSSDGSVVGTLDESGTDVYLSVLYTSSQYSDYKDAISSGSFYLSSTCSLPSGVRIYPYYSSSVFGVYGFNNVGEKQSNTMFYYLASWSVDSVTYFYTDGTSEQLSLDSYSAKPVKSFNLNCSISLWSTPPDAIHFCFPNLSVLCQLPDGQTISAIESQTNTLMDTSGSDSVAGGTVDSAVSSLGDSTKLMSQVSALAGKFTNLTSDASGVISFPGIKFGLFEIPATSVDVWANFSQLETPCKVICTGVLILLWIRGVQALFGRIFHGTQDVIVDEGDDDT